MHSRVVERSKHRAQHPLSVADTQPHILFGRHSQVHRASLAEQRDAQSALWRRRHLNGAAALTEKTNRREAISAARVHENSSLAFGVLEDDRTRDDLLTFRFRLLGRWHKRW